MSIENPFFVREVRAYSRKIWSPVGWQVLAAACGPLMGLWLTSRAEDWSDPWARGILLATIAGYHAVVCSMAGWRLGARVFGAEQQQNTLESLQLVSASPWAWVPQKLLFPVYALLLVWLAALPGCMALVIRGHFLPATIWPGLLLAGAAGLLSLGAALVVPPERVGLPRASERRLPLAQRLELASLRLVTMWLSWEILQLGYRWIETGVNDQGPRFRQHLLFGTVPIRADQVLGGMLALFLLYALTCAWVWANPASPAANRLRRAMQIVTLSTGYLLLVGITWSGSQWFWQTLLVGVPAIQFFRLAAEQRRLRRSRRALRGDSPRAAQEIAVIQARWDNPVLVRDLRVSLRGGGLLPSFLRQWLVLGAIGGVLAAYLFSQQYLLRASNFPFIASMLAGIFGWGAFVAVMRTGFTAGAQWGFERRMRTISQLMLSPLPGHDIVVGRWAAALLQGGAVSIPWVVSFLACTYIASNGEGLQWTICFGAWLLSLSLVLSAGMAGASRELSRWREWWSPSGASVAWFLAQPFLLIKGASSGSGGEIMLALCLVLTLINAVVVPVLLVCAGQQIEFHRARVAE